MIRIDNEIWKDIINYEGYYQISNKGRVKSLDRIIINCNNINQSLKGNILKERIDGSGYSYVELHKNNKYSIFKIHRLVAQAFIPNVNNLPFINHKDENKQNNFVENLEWCTQSYNILYSKINEKGGAAVAIPVISIDNNGIKTEYNSIIEASRKTGISRHLIKKYAYKNLTINGIAWRKKFNFTIKTKNL